jgi:hypothetical protein
LVARLRGRRQPELRTTPSKAVRAERDRR